MKSFTKTILAASLIALTSPVAFAAPAASEPIQGAVDCDRANNMDKVKALVKRAHEALSKNREKTIKEINEGSKAWRDGDLYVIVYHEGQVVAHGFNPAMIGRDLVNIKDSDGVRFNYDLWQMAEQKKSGCIKFKFPNPSKGGTVTDKIGYVEDLGGQTWVGSGSYDLK